MDPVQLHHYAEQRCKPFGCDLVRCMSAAQDPSKCRQAMKKLQQCVEEQKEVLKKEFAEGNKNLENIKREKTRI